jgi:hypothetical protein
MDKYILKPEYLDCDIITKTSDGTEVLVTKHTFNDHFGEMMFRNGQHSLLLINPRWNDDNNTEKKSYIQITENVISLISKPEEIVKNLQNQTVNELESKPKRGRPSRMKE